MKRSRFSDHHFSSIELPPKALSSKMLQKRPTGKPFAARQSELRAPQTKRVANNRY